MFPSELVLWVVVLGKGVGDRGYLLPPCSGLSSYGWHLCILTDSLSGNEGEPPVVPMTPVKKEKKKKQLVCGYNGGDRGVLVHLLHCLSHTVLDFMLVHQHAYQAST